MNTSIKLKLGALSFLILLAIVTIVWINGEDVCFAGINPGSRR